MALRALMVRQSDNQAEEDEVRRFFALLQSALSAGRCHVSDRHTQGAPEHLPHAWGWRAVPVPSSEGGTVEQGGPQGQRIGWTDGQTLWLDGKAAFATVQAYAREQGGLFEIGKTTLWKRVHERGQLVRTSKRTDGSIKPQVRERIGGALPWVYALSAEVKSSGRPIIGPVPRFFQVFRRGRLAIVRFLGGRRRLTERTATISAVKLCDGHEGKGEEPAL